MLMALMRPSLAYLCLLELTAPFSCQGSLVFPELDYNGAHSTGGEAIMVESLEGGATRTKVLGILARSVLRAAVAERPPEYSAGVQGWRPMCVAG